MHITVDEEGEARLSSEAPARPTTRSGIRSSNPSTPNPNKTETNSFPSLSSNTYYEDVNLSTTSVASDTPNLYHQPTRLPARAQPSLEVDQQLSPKGSAT